jgi:hypothetical protein
MIKLTEEEKELYNETAKTLKGSERRLFMARSVKALGWGGIRYAKREVGWNPITIIKGKRELESGIVVIDNFKARGRKSIEEKLPNLLKDITAIVDGESQIDPTFKTNNLYTRISVCEVRRQLIEQKGYTDEELPSREVIRRKLNQLGYKLQAVAKSKAKKK